jgi:tetratricopeptide (TPR) repeat protein/predicted aspartyl protease
MEGGLVRIRHLGYLAALAASSLSTGIAAANCQLQRFGTLPVDMHGLHPLISTKINGADARFLLDTGAFYSTIWREAATQYRLRISSLTGEGLYISGAGGNERAWVGTTDSFQFVGAPIPKVQFIVIDQTLSTEYVGVLGENLLRMSDAEYDLANGTVSFFHPVDCKHAALAYWAVTTPYSAVDLDSAYAVQFHLMSTATINGHNVSVMFDTGASNSLLSLAAAERTGITPTSPGVTFMGMIGGIGPALTRVWSAPFDTFQLGGEKVQHLHLLIANLGPNKGPDMVLGDDFFLSHRIYVAYSQDKLYFTYNGGPLFNLNVPQTATANAKPPASSGADSQASTTTALQPGADTPTDADGFRRRGLASAAMREFPSALADLTHACELAPNDAENHYDRGMIYFTEGQLKPALQDFDTAITLRPNDVDALLARAQLLLTHPDTDPTRPAVKVEPDLDTLSRLVGPAASMRLTLAGLYGRTGDYSAGIGQVDQWLSNHPNDQAAGLNARCWLRAAADQELQEALKDCNHALEPKPLAPEQTGSYIRAPMAADDPNILSNRGLVYLRLGNPKQAVQDYDSALHINPRMAESLYGRGLAELQQGETAQGQADLVAAEGLDKGIAPRFAKMGLTP